MKIELPKWMGDMIHQAYHKADLAEFHDEARPTDPLTRIADALLPLLLEAETEEQLEIQAEEDSWGAPGDPYYELEDELRAGEEPPPGCESGPEKNEPDPPRPDDGKPMPF